MKTLLVVGIGAGDPDHITIAATKAIASADVFLLFDKGEEKSELSDLRTELIERYGGEKPFRIVEAESPRWSSRGADYLGLVDDLNRRKVELTAELIRSAVREGERAAILVWGDPALYDSTIRILDAVAETVDLAIEVVPGITSIQALAARHRTPWNRIGGAVEITTGRRLAEALPRAETVLVMLDSRNAFLQHLGQGLAIRYGAYVGMPDEILVEGPLDAVADEIVRRRAEARARKGWIMDSYMLTRGSA